MKKNGIEILAPAGSLESLKAAVCAGADAVYIGGSLFGARAYADNPKEEELLEAIDYVHLHGRKIYLTVNTLLKENEMETLYEYLVPYYRQGLDAVIVQDIGVMQFVKHNFPDMSIHVSTQAAVTNALGASFFGRLGADRIVPARELSLKEVRDIKEKTGLEVECFVHGAMCYCYSGQCLLSSMIGGRSGNRGQCAQPCRLPYALDGKKPQDLLSLKDLCTIDDIPLLLQAGIDSFKIEGRMKQPGYVYTVVSMYRKYTDLYLSQKKGRYHVSDTDRQALLDAYTRRGYCNGYYHRQNGREMISLYKPECKGDTAKRDNDYKIKEKINGILILSEGKRATLSMEYCGNGEAVCLEVLGDVVQPALKAPLDKERVEKQLRKTGNTEFAFDSLKVTLEGSTFLPMQSLNELRREGLFKLTKQILSKYRRSVKGEVPLRLCAGEKEEHDTKERIIAVSVQNISQLSAVADYPFLNRIYIEGSTAFNADVLEMVQRIRKERDVRVYTAMPYIFRDRAIAYYETVYDKLNAVYDGILLRNFESFEWLGRKNYMKPVISDFNVYVFNKESKNFMKQTGFEDYTLPVELNFHELRETLGGGSLIVYGYQPVMISANCIKMTTKGCKKEEGIGWITDRCQKKFAVINFCKYCYNVMYNCMPLMLFDMRDEIEKLSPSGIRLDFTTEPSLKVREIMDLYQSLFLKQEEQNMLKMEYTRGHFKRGVK